MVDDIPKDVSDVVVDEKSDASKKSVMNKLRNYFLAGVAVTAPIAITIYIVWKFLEFLGYQKLLLKTNQESALKNVMASVKAHRGADTQNMEESSPAYDSKSNGFIERAIQTLEGQLRTLKAALEAHLDQKIPMGSHILPWLIEHASTLLNLFELHTDGRTPYQRLRGKQMHPPHRIC